MSQSDQLSAKKSNKPATYDLRSKSYSSHMEMARLNKGAIYFLQNWRANSKNQEALHDRSGYCDK